VSLVLLLTCSHFPTGMCGLQVFFCFLLLCPSPLPVGRVWVDTTYKLSSGAPAPSCRPSFELSPFRLYLHCNVLFLWSSMLFHLQLFLSLSRIHVGLSPAPFLFWSECFVSVTFISLFSRHTLFSFGVPVETVSSITPDKPSAYSLVTFFLFASPSPSPCMVRFISISN